MDRERHPPLADDAVVDCEYARVVVFGMGRVGAGAYDEIVERWGAAVLGVDRSERAVASHCDHGRKFIRGDALDRDFWERLRFRSDVELFVIATDNHAPNLKCVERVKEFLPEARIAAIAKYPDQVVELNDAGVDVERNPYEEAGQGLADDAVITVWGLEQDVENPGDADGSEAFDGSLKSSDGH